MSQEITKEALQEQLSKNIPQKEIAKFFNVGLWTIEKLINKYSLQGMRELHKLNLENIDISKPEFMYIVGLTASDGNIRKKTNTLQFRLKGKTSERLLTKIASFLGYKGCVIEYTPNCYDLIITSKYLKTCLLLPELGLTDTDKTHNLKFPSNFKSEDCAKMYWRGLIDGDGRIRYGFKADGFIVAQTISVYTCSEEFILGCIYYLNTNFGFNLNLARFKNKQHIVGFDINKRDQVLTLLDWIYSYQSSIPNLYLEHKYLPYKLLKEMMI